MTFSNSLPAAKGLPLALLKRPFVHRHTTGTRVHLGGREPRGQVTATPGSFKKNRRDKALERHIGAAAPGPRKPLLFVFRKYPPLARGFKISPCTLLAGLGHLKCVKHQVLGGLQEVDMRQPPPANSSPSPNESFSEYFAVKRSSMSFNARTKDQPARPHEEVRA